jgi:hypothetical protein
MLQVSKDLEGVRDVDGGEAGMMAAKKKQKTYMAPANGVVPA